MSFVQFKARISPPGRSYYGHLLGEFYSHYVEQYEAQKRITTLRKDHQILCGAFQQFCNLKSVSLRNAKPEQYPYWQESWTYALRNVPLGGEMAHRNITHAIRARHKPCCEVSFELAKIGDHPRPFTEITFFSAIELPPIFSQVPFEQDRFEFNPLDTSSRNGLANITTLNLDLRSPRRSKYQAYQTDSPRPKYWSTEQLAHALSSLDSLENLRLCVEEPGRRGARFLENPLRGSWKSLRVVIVSGWEFTEEDVIGFAERHAQTLQSFFAGYLSLIVHKDEDADDVFFRVWAKLRDMKFECLLDGPFYWDLRDRGPGDDVVERTQIPIDLNLDIAEGLHRRRRVLEDSLFAFE